mgnify:CR=1 FL=1
MRESHINSDFMFNGIIDRYATKKLATTKGIPLVTGLQMMILSPLYENRVPAKNAKVSSAVTIKNDII